MALAPPPSDDIVLPGDPEKDGKISFRWMQWLQEVFKRLNTPNNVVQIVSTLDGAPGTSGTTLMPIDNTIPQITEGTEFLTGTITPQDSNNIIRVEVLGHVANNTASRWVSGALFKDSVVDAIASCAIFSPTATVIHPHNIFTEIVAGATDPITFSYRVGAHAASTCFMNGGTAIGYHGGAMISSIKITEYSV